MAENQDATLLQRRARRRLVGAIALVVLIVILLPIVLDREPSPIGQDLVVEIPSQEAGKFHTRVLPPSGAANGAATAMAEAPKFAGEAAPPKAAPAPAVPAPASGGAAPGQKPASPAGDKKVEEDKADMARAQALLEGKDTWVVPLAAFSSQDNARKLAARLTAAGIRNYTEIVRFDKGERTRVRAGPFDSKPAAEEARAKLAAMGLHPAAPVTH